MGTRSPKVPADSKSYPAILAAHARVSVVMGLLRSIALPKRYVLEPNSEFMAWADRNAHALFSDSPASAAESDHVMLSFQDGEWTNLFTVNKRPHPRGRDSVPALPLTAYDLAALYGIGAQPANAAGRFNDMAAYAEQGQKKGRAKYDQNVLAWAKYASDLVRENGGWSKFKQNRSLDTIKEASKPEVYKKPVLGAPSRDCPMVMRVLALLDDRYLQVLASPVAILWHLWALPIWNEFRLGDPVAQWDPGEGNEEPFIEVVFSPDDTKGMPYPFGAASEALAQSNGSSQHTWTPMALRQMLTSLGDGESPPVLFATREDWNPLPGDGVRSPRKLMHISLPCDLFATIHHRVGTAPLPGGKPVIAFESESWGDTAIRNGPQAELCTARACDRHELVALPFTREPHDFVLGHFPADLLYRTQDLKKNGLLPGGSKPAAYEPISVWDTRKAFPDDSSAPLRAALRYITPGVAIWGPSRILDVPRLERLLVQFGTRLSEVVKTVRRFVPATQNEAGEPAKLDVEFVRKMLYLEQQQNRGQRPKASPTEPDLATIDVVKMFRRIGELMTSSIFANVKGNDEAHRVFSSAFNTFGWCVLLDYVPYAQVLYTHEFMTGEKP